MADTGYYFYAISRGLDPDVLNTEVGIEQAALQLVKHQDLGAVVSHVSLQDFGEEGLRRNLEDLAWLESVAVTHDRVARFCAERATTAPLRMATVFLSEDAVREQLAQWYDRAEEVLNRIEGRSEWSVKAYAEPAAPAETGGDEPPETMGEGMAYLLRRRTEAQRRESTAQADAEAAQAIHDLLSNHAVAGRQLRPQDRQLTGHTGEMILNGTYLVDQGRVDEFLDTVAALRSEHPGVRVEHGGPWPPYSFATLEPE